MAKRPIKPDDLLELVFVGDPQFSPCGNLILFAKSKIEKNKMRAQLCTVDVRSREVRTWTQGDGGAGHGRWSPDGTQIAFISGRDKPSAQIYLLPTHGGEARKLTQFPEGSLGEFAWSPDGTKIAATFRGVDEERTSKAAKEREAEGWSTPPWIIETLWYRLDGDGYFGQQRHKLYVIDVATGDHKELYSACTLGLYSFDWLADSSGLVVAHTANTDPFNQPENDQLYIVKLDGTAQQVPGLPSGPKGAPAVSPDGKQVAYLGHEGEDPWGVYNMRAYVVALSGGEPRCLTANDDLCLATATLSDTAATGAGRGVQWTPDGKSLVVQAAKRGEVQLGWVDVEKGGLSVPTQGKHGLAIGSVSPDGKAVAGAVQTPSTPAEICMIDIGSGEVVTLTDLNASFVEEVELGQPEDFTVEASDGAEVHAWVLKPHAHNPARKGPALLAIHGGPHTQYGWTFFHEFQVLAAAGYTVVYSNPRGSKGYGEEFCAAIRGDWGNKDWLDVQAVVHWMQHQPWIHPGRMGVQGGSYGGYMTNWVVGHCKDFKAAITDRCVSNWVSMAGNSDFPNKRDGYWKGYPYGDLDAIAKLWQQSPLASFDQVTTPMLIIHSEGDLRCNVEQSEQVFHALKMQGIEARFVRYPVSTSHGMSRNGPPDLRLHRLGEMLSWWGRHLA